MASGKTPGLDGLPIEWYKTFMDLLVPKLCQVYEEISDKGILSAAFNQVYTTVLPQRGKDHAQYANYLPILLINVDTKILRGAGKLSFKYHILQCGPTARHNYTVCTTCNFRLTDMQLTITCKLV